jgi:hypothetical protein
MKKIAGLLSDLFFFVQVLLYWPIAFIILKPLCWIDRITGAGFFKYIDRFVKKIAGE